LTEKIKVILSDKRSGSTRVTLRLLKAIIDTDPDTTDALKALALVGRSTDMVVLANMAAACTRLMREGEAPSSVARTLIEELEDAAERCAQNGARLLSAHRTFLTLSNSEQLQRLFTVLGPVKVYILESRPGGEGVVLGRKLSGMGVEAKVIPDLSAHLACLQVDCVVVGSDAVYRNHFVNKLGTGLLARLSTMYSKPLYVLTTRWKAATRARRKHPINVDFTELFEDVDNSAVEAYITEFGEIQPSKAHSFLSARLHSTGI
jgi:translation initiation factor 2B subunit (eIF-2B alpha/beta/delta family)